MRIFHRVILPSVLVLVIFGGAFAGIAVALGSSQDFAERVRGAQSARAYVLRLQLDEESGMRGYAATGEKVFLQPYSAAITSFARAFATERTAASTVAPGALSAIDDEGVTNARWVREVAAPLIANRARADAFALQLNGKSLVDRFRAEDTVVVRSLDRTATDSDTRAHEIVDAIVAGGLILGLAGMAFVLWAGARRHALEMEYARQTILYEREQQIGDTLQQALLARELPAVPGITLHARYRPADAPERVGGDWYDAFELADERLFIMVGDVSGHGIAATLRMSGVRQAIVAAAFHENDPAAILTFANRRLLKTHPTEPILGTVVCAFVDPATRSIAYASAGHPVPILVEPNGPASYLARGGLPLGVEDRPYRTNVVHASLGSLLVFYTDGLLEYTRDIVEGEARLLEAARSVGAGLFENPALAIKQKILGTGSPHDDVAVLTVTFLESGVKALSAQLAV